MKIFRSTKLKIVGSGLMLLTFFVPALPKSNKVSQPAIYGAQDRLRFMQQATWGYDADLDNYLSQTPNGIEVYLNNQLDLVEPQFPFPEGPNYQQRPYWPELICNNDQLTDPDVPDVPATCYRDTYTMYPLQKWFFKEALYSPSQLRHRVAWALSQIWVTSANEIRQSRHMTQYYKTLYKYALGDPDTPGHQDYLELMKAMTLNPAMGEYLDMAYSTAAVPNENYPRELLQLFTTGVNELDANGVEILSKNGNPIPIYDQPRIEEFAKVFTGWTFCNANGSLSQSCPNVRLGAINFIDPMLFNPDNHNVLQKNLFNYPGAPHPIITHGLPGNTELDYALENIFYHPSLGPFVCKQLIQHLVGGQPSAAYVGRVAAKFANNGNNVRGDLKEVVRAILLDPEARGDSSLDPFGKLREPVQFTTNILRALNVEGFDGNPESDGVLFEESNFKKMGQNPFYSPSVFNYYSPKNTVTVEGDTIVAPEFALFTPTTSVIRANFARKLIYGGIANNGGSIPNGTKVNLSDLITYSMNDVRGYALVNELDRRLLDYTMPQYMRDRVLSAITAIPKTNAEGRVKAAVYLVVTSAEFQVQR